MTRLILLTGTLLIIAEIALAQGAQNAPCAVVEHRQFDFWIGTWTVTTSDGNIAGENRIERILGDCVIYESWDGAGGTRGHSFNVFDASTGKWHQTWVDTGGTLLLLDGGIVDGAMVLEGTRPGADGRSIRHRISWTPLDDGDVRQHWEYSRDAGATWETLFDGRYHKAK